MTAIDHLARFVTRAHTHRLMTAALDLRPRLADRLSEITATYARLPDQSTILDSAYRADRQHLISRSARLYPAKAAQIYRLSGAHGNLRSDKLVVRLSVTSCTTRTVVPAFVVDHGEMAFEVNLVLQKAAIGAGAAKVSSVRTFPIHGFRFAAQFINGCYPFCKAA